MKMVKVTSYATGTTGYGSLMIPMGESMVPLPAWEAAMASTRLPLDAKPMDARGSAMLRYEMPAEEPEMAPGYSNDTPPRSVGIAGVAVHTLSSYDHGHSAIEGPRAISGNHSWNTCQRWIQISIEILSNSRNRLCHPDVRYIHDFFLGPPGPQPRENTVADCPDAG